MKKSIASRMIAVILAALMLLFTAVTLTGCGDDKTKATEATAAPTAATDAATEAATEAQSTEAEDQGGDQGQSTVEFDEDGYISQSLAVENVKAIAGSGAQILDIYKGTSPEGFKAWVITVAPVTTSDGPESVTYYSGYQFCYAENYETLDTDTSDTEFDEDGYISESLAITNVKMIAGYGAQILDSYKGTSPEGFKAWVVTVAPITTADGPESVTYYSGYQFCYAAEQ